MGKASKWFRGLLNLKRPEESQSATATATVTSASKPPKEKRRWSFVKSYREKDINHHATAEASDPNKHAMAVAAAATAMAEAAVAAVHAAAAVANNRNAAGGISREEWAAVKIQAAFRGCLARKALRALKGLVKLQALVRGHIERKRTAEWLQRMLALFRAQALVRAGRTQNLHSSYWNAKSSIGHLHGPETPDIFESPIRFQSKTCDRSLSVPKRNSSKSHVQTNVNEEIYGSRSDCRIDKQSWMKTCSMDDERAVRILEMDSGKPHIKSKRRNLFYSSSQPLFPDHYSQSLTTTTKDSTSHQSGQSPSSCEVQSYNSPLKVIEAEENSFYVADTSPQILSASSKTSPFTPTRSDGSRSYLSGYSDYPSYMANTESSKAKVRSLSAPKQRPQYERSTSSNRYSLHRFGEPKLTTQRVSALQASFTSKAYPGSGRLDNLGLPMEY